MSIHPSFPIRRASSRQGARSSLLAAALLVAALLAALPATGQPLGPSLAPDGPLVDVGSIGPGYSKAELATVAQRSPRILMDDGGGFLVLWWQADKSLTAPRLMVRRFAADGAPMWVEQEIWDPVDEVGDVRGLNDAAMNGDGDFVIAWSEAGEGVFYRLFDPCRVPFGPIVEIGNGQPTVGQSVVAIRDVAVGLGSDDTVVVAWIQTVEAPAAEGSGTFDEVIVERFDASGTLVDELARIDAQAVIVGLDVEVAADGSYGVAYEALTTDPAASYVRLAMFDATGHRQVVSPPPGHPSLESPRLAADGTGSVLLATADSGGQGPNGVDGSCSGVFARVHAGSGSVLVDETQVNPMAAGCQGLPRAAGLAAGWLVAWAGADADATFGNDASGFGVYTRLYAADGTALGDAVRVLPGWATPYELAAGGERAAVAAVLPTGPGGAPRAVVQRLAPWPAASCELASGLNLLCLEGERFRVDVDWRDPYNLGHGLATSRELDGIADSGAFWYFKESNLELLVKVLDGVGVNGYHWVFYGSLSTVETWVTVTDLEAGGQRVYHNPPFQQASVADTTAFPAGPPPGAAATASLGADAAGLAGGIAGGVFAVPARDLAGGVTARTGGCTPQPAAPGIAESFSLCLQDDRFAVGVDWTNPRTGNGGAGHPVPISGDTGGFWFFNEQNVELLVKVLDGRPVNGYWWVFYAGLSDVGYSITVTPAGGGDPVVYTKAPYVLQSGADTTAVPE